MRNQHTISSFKRSISFSIVAPLLLLLIITGFCFILIYNKNKFEIEKMNVRQILASNALFQSNLSEKLAIVSSSNSFIDFITAGKITRNNLLPKFLEQIALLKSNSIVGISLIDNKRNSILNEGNQSNHYVLLKICYLSNHLNNKYGKCNYFLKLYFSMPGILYELKKNNNSIILCKKCKPLDLLDIKNFGTFMIHEKSSLLMNLTVKTKQENLWYYYLCMMALLVTFAIANNIRISRIINKVIAIPIQKLVSDIMKGKLLKKSENSLQEINYLIDQIDVWIKKIDIAQEVKHHASIGKLIGQIAHDIRSPLTVMEISLTSLKKQNPTEDIFLLKEAIQSVRNKMENILHKYRQVKNSNTLYDKENSRPILLTNLLETIISQKQQEWKNRPCEIKKIINNDAINKWINVIPDEAKRVLSNIMNNAYEALNNEGIITVVLSCVNNHLHLKIIDNGHGIPSDKINAVLNGFSLKHNGSGLGLVSAREYMSKIGGTLTLISEVNRGTQIQLHFPIISNPNWLPQNIGIPQNATIVILDDDATIHNFWKHHLHPYTNKLKHFVSNRDLKMWYESFPEKDNTIFLLDYDLKDEVYNGLEILISIKNNKHRYLITNHAEEFNVQEACQQANIFLLPKTLLHKIPLQSINL